MRSQNSFLYKIRGYPQRGHQSRQHPYRLQRSQRFGSPRFNKSMTMPAKLHQWKNLTKRLVSLLVKRTSLNESNKASAISEFLQEWEKITSDKWVLETVKGAKIDVNNVKKVPLNDQNFSERFSQTVVPLIQKEINRLLKKGVITEVSGMELRYLSPIFLRAKKDNNHRLILNLKELNKFVPHHHLKMDTLKSTLNMTRKMFHNINWPYWCILQCSNWKFSPNFLCTPISRKILEICMFT